MKKQFRVMECSKDSPIVENWFEVWWRRTFKLFGRKYHLGWHKIMNMAEGYPISIREFKILEDAYTYVEETIKQIKEKKEIQNGITYRVMSNYAEV